MIVGLEEYRWRRRSLRLCKSPVRPSSSAENVLNNPRKSRKMHRKKESTWQRNAASQIVLDSIFAALAGIWITFALPDNIPTRIRFIEVLCSLLSFFCFAVSAEGTTTAYDEWDLMKYV